MAIKPTILAHRHWIHFLSLARQKKRREKRKSLGHCQSDAVLGVYWQNMVVSVCLKLRQKQSMSGSPVNDTSDSQSVKWKIDHVVSYSPPFPTIQLNIHLRSEFAITSY